MLPTRVVRVAKLAERAQKKNAFYRNHRPMSSRYERREEQTKRQRTRSGRLAVEPTKEERYDAHEFLVSAVPDGSDGRPGNGGHIGAEAAAKAPPSGYTLVMPNSSHATSPSMYKKLRRGQGSEDPV